MSKKRDDDAIEGEETSRVRDVNEVTVHINDLLEKSSNLPPSNPIIIQVDDPLSKVNQEDYEPHQNPSGASYSYGGPSQSYPFAPYGAPQPQGAFVSFGDTWENVGNKLQRRESKYHIINGGDLLKKKLKEKNKKRKGKKLEVKTYSTQRVNSLSNFLGEINMIKCNSAVKFYSGTLPPEPGTSTNTKDDVVVQTIEGGVPEARQEDFRDELIFLSEPRQNLVRVLGFSLVTREPVIVYEHRADEIITLFEFTSGSSVHTANFSCEKRIDAAKGVARGLEHFYKFKFNPTYVRGDISSANIMMDITSYEPKIFYAAGSNLIPPAPVAKDLKEKREVYSFGTILVELLTGGRTVGTDLSNSIERAQAHGLFEILDDEMKGKGMVVSKIATVADKCLNVIQEQRPTMKEVLDELLDRPAERHGGFWRLFHR